MKYYAVVPPKYWEECNNTKIKMLVEAKDLLKHRKSFGLYAFGHDWILDNSTALGEEVTLIEYIDLIKQYEPPIVVVPDILNDRDRTLERTADFINRIEATIPDCPSKFMMVPQGESLQDFTLCLEALFNIYDPDIVGIPYRYKSPYFVKERNKPVEWALDRSMLVKNVVLPNLSRGTEIHLLGLWHPFELVTGQLMALRSCDSSLVWRCAVNKVNLFAGERDLDLSVFDKTIDFERYKSIYQEFRTFVRLLGGLNDLLPNRFEQSDPDKRIIAEGGSVGSPGGSGSEDPGSSSVER